MPRFPIRLSLIFHIDININVMSFYFFLFQKWGWDLSGSLERQKKKTPTQFTLRNSIAFLRGITWPTGTSLIAPPLCCYSGLVEHSICDSGAAVSSSLPPPPLPILLPFLSFCVDLFDLIIAGCATLSCEWRVDAN